jgi:uncharacterized protein YaaN involved in tellurite resistance
LSTPVPAASTALSPFIEPVAPGRELELSKHAEGFAAGVAQYHPHSPEFAARVADIQTLASKEIVAAGSGGSRLLDRTVASSARTGGPSAEVAKNLSDLRGIVDDLTPDSEKGGLAKVFAKLPGGKKLNRWLQRYESYADQIKAIVKSLENGKLALQKDNADLRTEQQTLRENMKKLADYIVFADQLDAHIAAEVERLRAAGNLEGASALEQEILFEVRQKAQNLRVQLAAADQGYLSMDLVRKNNVELMKGVDNTLTVTVSAMRTTVMVASALETQQQVLTATQKTREATEQMMLRNSERLRQQGAAIQEQAASPAISLEVLAESFGNIRAAIEDVETFRSRAVVEMAENNQKLDAQLEEVRPFVERAAAIEQAQAQTQAALNR